MATLALVSPENVQIVSVFEMEDGSGHTEIFTRVLLGGIVVEQVEGEPTLEVEPETLTEDEALLDVYAAVENLEDSLPTAQLLAMGGWEHPLLQLGTVEVSPLGCGLWDSLPVGILCADGQHARGDGRVSRTV